MPPGNGSSQSDSEAAAPMTIAAAEAAADDAAVRARRARRRANRLRRKAHQRNRHRFPKQRRWRRPRARTLIASVGVLLICASSAGNASMWWQHRVAAGERQRSAEFAAAARQAAVMLLTIDYTNTRDGIQRVLDNSTGAFKSRFEKTAPTMVERLQESKVVITAEVKDAAVQSASDNAGVVLVAAQTEGTEKDGQRQSASWRIALSLTREDGRLKIANVEFVT